MLKKCFTPHQSGTRVAASQSSWSPPDPLARAGASTTLGACGILRPKPMCRRNFELKWPLLLTAAVLVSMALPGGNLYVDCTGGDDAREGSTPATAVRTIAAANKRTFSPGDSILLRRRTTCAGMFSPSGSGTAKQPITLGAYGSGPAPVIDGGGNESAIRLFNQQGWHLENIETSGGSRYGIHVGGDKTRMSHFRITNVDAHDVHGALTSKDSGLIVFSASGSGVFDDVVIDGATAWNTTQWAGIEIVGAGYTGKLDGPHGSNVTVRNSLVHDVYGDGIILFVVEHGLIERSAAWRTGQQPKETIGTPNAIWTWMCNECLVQYNEAWLSSSPSVDGGAFDIDWGNRNNTVQFNYGHDSKGYCAAVFGAGGLTTVDSVIRSNVCVNNGRDAALAKRQGDLFLSTWDNGKLDGVLIQGNHFYWNPAGDYYALNNAAEFAGDHPNRSDRNVVESHVPSLILSNASLQLDGNTYQVVENAAGRFEYGGAKPSDFAAYQAASGQEEHSLFSPMRHGVDTRPNRKLEHSLLGDTAGSPAIISLIGNSTDAHSQLIFLRSMKEQYTGRGLKVHIVGSPDPNWRLDGISIARPAVKRRGRVETFLVSAEGVVVEHWRGLAPADELGLAVQRLLGQWPFSD